MIATDAIRLSNHSRGYDSHLRLRDLVAVHGIHAANALRATWHIPVVAAVPLGPNVGGRVDAEVVRECRHDYGAVLREE